MVAAVAGAGKSTALQELARRHPNKRIVYVVFNESVQVDQQRQYVEQGLWHVRVRTLDARRDRARRTNATLLPFSRIWSSLVTRFPSDVISLRRWHRHTQR